MALTYLQFSAYFPEFADKTQLELENQITKVTLLTNGYAGVVDPIKRDLAVGYHVAHSLAIAIRQVSGEIGAKTKIKSYNDAVEFAVSSDQSGYGFGSTTYGIELQQLLDSELVPPLMY